jgi:enterochelin esterase-like enzyme
MKNRVITTIRPILSCIFVAALIAISVSAASASIHFKVKLDPSLAAGDRPVSGRLLIFMTKSDKPLNMIGPDFTNPDAVWISAAEVTDLQLKHEVELDADALSYPGGFSTAPAGDYQVMALLDRDHSYTYFNNVGDGDIYSTVIKASMPSNETTLTLSKVVPARKTSIPANVRVVEFESPMLSKFWGRPIKMQASVVLPPGYDSSRSQRYPTVYSIHGYGGDHLNNLGGVPAMTKEMSDGGMPEMIYVYLNAHCPLGHHVFADSDNNGPWGSALVKEFIPYLEKQFRMDARPSGRFLTGHSSGGWSSLWVMITHPDFFAGTWSTSPDPVDLRSITGPNFDKLDRETLYADENGKEFNLVRFNGMPVMSVRQYVMQERVLGDYGGQFASFEAAFSPKGDDGRPMPLADRETGKVNPDVAKAWERYDISRVLRDNWSTLGPKLKGKLHIAVGTADTFHLDEPVRLLDAELKKLGSDARIEYIEGRDHFNLYEGGLRERFAREMYAVARPSVRSAAK